LYATYSQSGLVYIHTYGMQSQGGYIIYGVLVWHGLQEEIILVGTNQNSPRAGTPYSGCSAYYCILSATTYSWQMPEEGDAVAAQYTHMT